MAGPDYLSPFPRYSTFHFPWLTGDNVFHLDQAIQLEKEESEKEYPDDVRTQAGPLASGGAFSRTQAPRKIAMQLLRHSWCIFKDLKLDDWVKFVMGMPSTAISLFESYHKELGHTLFCFLQQFPCDVEIFWEATKTVQQIDRFLYSTLSHALKTFENKRPYHNLPIEAGVIAGPLKVLLDRPDRYILQRLKVLEPRYARYKLGSDIARGRAFEVRTDFFTAVSEQSAATIAWKMTQEVVKEFSNISVRGLLFHDDHLHHLAQTWDLINHDAEEVAATAALVDKLGDVARELYHLRNYFCLCAVLSGMVQAQLQIESTFTGFVDPIGNYRQYRLQLHTDNSLPFIYPLIIELRRGHHEVLKEIFSFLLYERFLCGDSGRYRCP